MQPALLTKRGTVTQQRARALLQLARFDPVRYQKEILHLDLQPWQIEATEAVFDVVRKFYGKPTQINHEAKPFFTVRAMHGPGKTFWLASLIHTFGMAFPKARIPCIAPKMDQLRTRLWMELRKIADSAGEEYRPVVDIQSTTMRFFGMEDWFAFAQTATRAENLAGLHHDFILVAIDEASGVPEHLWPTIFGAVASGKIAIMVLIANPTRNTGTFAESWLRPQVSRKFHQIAITLDKAPRVSREWVAAMAQKYGEKSNIFRIRCLGQFAEAGEDQLIPLQWIIDARNEEGVEFSDGSLPRMRLSVDVADGGLDETVITVGRLHATKLTILKMRRFSFPASESPISAGKAAVDMFDAWGCRKEHDDIVVDALGVGAGTAGFLLDKGYSVVTYQGGAASDDPARWRCRRVQSFINLRNALRDKSLEFVHDFLDDDDWEDFMAQMCSIEVEHGRDRVEDLITKMEMKRRGIKSPDMADSLAMQFATQAPRLQLGPVGNSEPLVTFEHDTWSNF